MTEYSAEHREMRVCKAWQRTAIEKLGAAQTFQKSHRTGRRSSSNQSERLKTCNSIKASERPRLRSRASLALRKDSSRPVLIKLKTSLEEKKPN